MFGRRTHARFVLANAEGVLRVARDVEVTSSDGELVALSSEPWSLGDALTIEIVVNGQVDRVAVRVEESRPIVVAGALRHRIRLSRAVPNGEQKI